MSQEKKTLLALGAGELELDRYLSLAEDQKCRGIGDKNNGRIDAARELDASKRSYKSYKMSITYKTNKDLPCDQLLVLFAAVGWSDETKEMTSEMLANFNKPFIHSTLVFSAWDEDKLVGCVRALSDTMFRSVIFDLAVLPEYQKQGIGSQLVKKCIGVYPNSEWSLETIPERVSFYEGLGFEISNGPVLKIPCKWF